MDTVTDITLRTLAISGTATLLATTWSLPLAYRLAVKGPRTVAEALESIVGIPTVLIGLLLYLLFSRHGPLGPLRLLYTPQSIIIGESILITPLLIGTLHRVITSLYDTYGETAITLGATPSQARDTVLSEALPAIAGSTIMAFSRATGELGIALLVGGNLEGKTRTITTAIALDVSMGEFGDAIKLGLALLAILIITSILLNRFNKVSYR